MKLTHAVRFVTFGLLLLVIPAALSFPSAAQIGVGIGISVRIGPPALPVYDQPICPGPGYMWTPGYWAWDDDDGYYWVPGTWVEAPEPGLLWTPGYWGWNDGVYVWNAGYWGPQIGFYGGINYGFGYGGNGFYGGEWRGGQFFYNTAVMHVNTSTITNVYVNRTVIVNNRSHVAFNGGQGGVAVRPSPQQVAYAHETHTPPVAAQTQQREAASKNRALFASTNHGRPAVAATAKPGEFSGRSVVAARAAGGTYHAPAMSPKEARASAPAGNRAAESRPAENRAAKSHPAENRSAENRAANRAESANRPANNRPARTTTENAARAPESHPAKPSKPETSHAKAESAPRTESARSSTEPKAKPESKLNPAPKARESEPKASAKPHESTAKTTPAPRENSPKATPKPREDTAKASPPARKSAPKASPKPKASAPKESAPKASPEPRASAPKPEKTEPPKKESSPKEPKK